MPDVYIYFLFPEIAGEAYSIRLHINNFITMEMSFREKWKYCLIIVQNTQNFQALSLSRSKNDEMLCSLSD